MIKKEVTGTYWCWCNRSGELWIMQDEETPTVENDVVKATSYPDTPWLFVRDHKGGSVYGSEVRRADKLIISSNDFKDVKFPEMEECSLKEIEIVESGKVYIY